MFKFLINLFFNNNNSEEEKKPRLAGFSYLFKAKRVCFEEKFNFTIHYLFNNEVWLAACSVAEGLGFENSQYAIENYVSEKYKRTVNQLVFNNQNDDGHDSLICINKLGVLQLLDYLDFENKAEFIAWIIEDLFCQLEDKFIPSPLDLKITKVLNTVDYIKQHNDETVRTNDQFKSQVIERFECFNKQITELHNKISMYDNIEELYNRLQDHHGSRNFLNTSSDDDDNNNINNNNNMCRYETVRFPRDASKHPRLTIFAKPSEDGTTQLSFLASQQRHHNSLKRKYGDMEMIYDNIHPNPQMAMYCINEELDLKNFNYTKRSRRTIILNCSMDTAKSFISENV